MHSHRRPFHGALDRAPVVSDGFTMVAFWSMNVYHEPPKPRFFSWSVKSRGEPPAGDASLLMEDGKGVNNVFATVTNKMVGTGTG